MALLDRFKKAGPAKAATPAPPVRSTPEAKEPRPGRPAGMRRIIGLVVAPHLTEKTSRASEKNWYTFRVAPGASKIAIRQALEERYGVHVRRVRIIYRRPKRVRIGRATGRTPGFKKAMVKVRAGETIDFT